MSLDPGSFLLIMTTDPRDPIQQYEPKVSVASSADLRNLQQMSNVTLSKNWLLGGRKLEFEGSISLRPGALSNLIDGCLREVTPLVGQAANAHEMIDLKGRDPHDIILPGVATPRSDELFRIGGIVAVVKKGSDFDWEPFEVVCYSPFNRFEGAHHIIHSMETERAGSLPSWLPTSLIGMAAPIKPRFFRFGLERFKSMLTFASLGYAPQVTTTLLIDCVADTLAFKLTHEFKKASDANPFETIPAYRALAGVVTAATSTDIMDELQTKLTKS